MPANSVDTARLLPELRQRARRITLRACAGCGRPTPGTRCPSCAPATGYDTDHRRARGETLATEFICWRCGQPARHGDPLEADHVTARIHGGLNVRTNYRAAHRSCNRRAGAATTNAASLRR